MSEFLSPIPEEAMQEFSTDDRARQVWPEAFRPLSEEESGTSAESEAYWAQFSEGVREGMRRRVESFINESAADGSYSLFSGGEVPDEAARQKLAAYREVAQSLGYEVGPYIYSKVSRTATAELRSPKQVN